MSNAKHFLLLNVLDSDLQRTAVTKRFRDLIAAMPNQDVDIFDAQLAHDLDLVGDLGLVTDRQEWFWITFCERLHAHTVSCSENHPAVAITQIRSPHLLVSPSQLERNYA